MRIALAPLDVCRDGLRVGDAFQREKQQPNRLVSKPGPSNRKIRDTRLADLWATGTPRAGSHTRHGRHGRGTHLASHAAIKGNGRFGDPTSIWSNELRRRTTNLDEVRRRWSRKSVARRVGSFGRGAASTRAARKKMRREVVRAQCALQSIRNSPLDTGVLTRPILLFADQLLVQSFRLIEVAPLWVRRSRYAVGRSLDFAVFLRRTVPEAVKFPTFPLYEFRLRLEPFPASPSQPSRSTGRLLS